MSIQYQFPGKIVSDIKKKKKQDREREREREIAIQFDAILRAFVRSNVVISIIIK
jgi:hypothetical protein